MKKIVMMVFAAMVTVNVMADNVKFKVTNIRCQNCAKRVEKTLKANEAVQEVNALTVIANESYSDFVKGLQNETREALRERPSKATVEYFTGKVVQKDGQPYTINEQDAMMITGYLMGYCYVDNNLQITEQYKKDSDAGKLMPLFPGIAPIADEVHKLIRSLFDESVELENMVEDANKSASFENKLNDNFYKKEFQALWNEINHQYVYTVHYDSKELIEKAVNAVNAELVVTELKYVMTKGEQEEVDTYGNTQTTTRSLSTISTSSVRYDLVGDIARKTTLTRKTVAEILRTIRPTKLQLFRNNPEEFIKNVSRIIKEQKATMIVEHIQYDKIDQVYDSTIFTKEKSSQPVSKAYQSTKSIQDYIFTDGYAEESIEKKFAKALDEASEVCVYAKLPRSFHIPTPVGSYSPDWAIAFNKGTVKHIFFIAETKGSMDSMNLKPIEKAKIDCAEKLFNDVSTSNVRYHKVDSYQTLLDIMKSMD